MKGGGGERSIVIGEEDGGRAAEEIKRLKLLIQQKDNEMALLVSLTPPALPRPPA